MPRRLAVFTTCVFAAALAAYDARPEPAPDSE